MDREMDMRSQTTRVLAMAVAGVLWAASAHHARAEAVDFSTFISAQGIPTSFVDPQWIIPTDFNGMAVPAGSIAREITNADTTLFHGPSTLDITNKIITGDFYAGQDDDYVGIALGVPADSNPMLNGAADWVLIQWKGLSQNFDWNDRLSPSDPGYFAFHNSTISGPAPIGLSLSRVKGLPTADEYWQRADLTMFDPQGKTAPDPLVDPILGSPETDSGGLTELARGSFYGNRTYGPRHTFEIQYTPENIKVWVDGFLEFDVNAPADQFFPAGTLGLYEQAQDPSGAFAFFDVRNPGEPAPEPAPSLLPQVPFGAADISVPESNTNAGSVWAVGNGTTGSTLAVLSAANVADIDFSIDGNQMLAANGVLMATVRQNGPRSNGDPAARHFAGAESPWDSGFGGVRSGIATFSYTNGAEWNVDVAIGFFPYSQFKGGYVNPQGQILAADDLSPASPYTVTQWAVPLPSIVKYEMNLDGTLPASLFFAGNQQFMQNVKIAGKDANVEGLLFTIGASNEDNVTAVAILPDGSWNVAVRDGDAAFYGAPDTFEQDDFAFLYLESGDVPGSVGGRVTGLEAGKPILAQEWGAVKMDRMVKGVYQLAIDGGEAFVINLINQRLTGDLVVNDTDTDSDGIIDSRTFTNTQRLVPMAADSSFSFAFIPFAGDSQGPGMLLLTPNDAITLSDGTIAPLNHFMTYQVPSDYSLDASGSWSDPANWRGTLPDGRTAMANFRSKVQQALTIDVEGDNTVAWLAFDSAASHTLTGQGKVILDSGGPLPAVLAAAKGEHAINVPVEVAGDAAIHVLKSAKLILGEGLSLSDGRLLEKLGEGTLDVSGGLHMGEGAMFAVSEGMALIDTLDGGAVHVGKGGQLVFRPGSLPGRVDALTFDGSAGAYEGMLDLTDNALLIGGGAAPADTLAHVLELVRSGQSELVGIHSSLATAVKGLAVLSAGEDVLVKYTYHGDTDGDGQISAADYHRIDMGFISQPVSPTYQQGDLNLDGQLNGDDYFMIDSAFMGQAAISASFAAVPEPAAAGLAAIGAGLLLVRRRGRAK